MRKLSLGSCQSPAHLLERGRAAHRPPLPLAASILALWLPAVNSEIEFIPRGLGKNLASKECVPSRGLAEMFMEFQNLLKWLEKSSLILVFSGLGKIRLTPAYRVRWWLVPRPVPMGLGENFIILKRSCLVLWRETQATGELHPSSSCTVRILKAF